MTNNIEVCTIINENGLSATITNYGLRILALHTPDKNKNFDNIVLGFNDIEQYHSEEGAYFGCIIGPFANRIEKAKYLQDGKQIELEANEGQNHVHGSSKGFHTVIWDIVHKDSNLVKFGHRSSEIETGYPGTMNIQVTYELTNKDELVISYLGETDTSTIMSLTNHSYFNLKGEGDGSILDHYIQIDAINYVTVNKELIPLEISPVENTPFDFREPSLIGKGLEIAHEQFENTKGYDHCFVLKALNNDELKHAVNLEDKTSGRVLDVFTTEPGIQLYTGNFLDGKLKGKSGEKYEKYSGLCLETQQFPNSPNRPDFPNPTIGPKKKYQSKTIYQFSVTNKYQN